MEEREELVRAAVTLGIPHPSGYPLYVLAGKVFSLLPFGDLAWRVNLMSAFFGALAATVLGRLAARLTNNFFGLLAGLLLAVTQTFWSQAVMAEVYTLHVFLFLLELYLFWRFWQTGAKKFFYWFALIAGLSLTNHLLSLLYLPVFLFFLIRRRPRRPRGKAVIVAGALFVLGSLVYLYLPLRSWQQPLLDWGNPETLSNFWYHVSRAQYRDFGLTGPGNKLLLVQTFFSFLVSELSLPLFVLALGGLVWLWRKVNSFAILSLLLFLMTGLGVIGPRSLGWSPNTEEIYKVYYLPAVALCSVWLAVVFYYFLQKFFFPFLKKFN